MYKLKNRSDLLVQINDAFEIEELKTLCFHLRINDGEFQKTQTPFARDLIAYCDRNNMAKELIDECKKSREHIDWGKYLELIETPFTPSPKKNTSRTQEQAHGFELLRNYLKANTFLLIVLITIIIGALIIYLINQNPPEEVSIDIYSVKWSPDGTLIASSAIDNAVLVWSAPVNDLVLKLNQHTKPVRQIAWSPNGRLLASASNDKSVIIWDISTGKTLQRLTSHDGPVRSVSWNPDGTKIATASEDRQVRIWDVTTGQLEMTLTGHSDWVRAVTWSPNGEILASVGKDNTLIVWKATGETVYENEYLASLYNATWKNDGSQLAIGLQSGELIILNTTDFSEEVKFGGHTDAVTSVAWSPDESKIATSSRDGTIIIRDVLTTITLNIFEANNGAVWNIDWSPDSTRIVSSGHDSTLIIWNILLGEKTQTIEVD